MPSWIAGAMLAATVPAGPAPAHPASDAAGWISIRDYPQAAIDGHQQGAVGYAVAIDASGTVTGCTVTATSGSPSLDATTCALIFVRARFAPALDAAGRPVAGSYASRVRWVYPARIETAVSLKPIELPSGIRSSLGASTLHVDANGIITQCDAVAEHYDNILPLPSICGLFPVGTRYGPPAVRHGKPLKRKIYIKLDVGDEDVR